MDSDDGYTDNHVPINVNNFDIRIWVLLCESYFVTKIMNMADLKNISWYVSIVMAKRVSKLMLA